MSMREWWSGYDVFGHVKRVYFLVRGVFNRCAQALRARISAVGAATIGSTLVLVGIFIFAWPQLAPFLGLGEAQAATYRFQTGYYMGDGGSKAITGLGFTPDLVIIKADTAAGTGAIMKTSVMPQNSVAYLGVATADDVTGQIQLTSDGFVVTGALTNTAGARHVYMAFGGSDCGAGGQFCVGAFTGDGNASQVVSTGFSPDLVLAKPTTAVLASWRSSSMADNVGQYFAAAAEDNTGTLFTTLDGNGFSVGSGNNTPATTYHFVAFREASGSIDVGTYTGDGLDNRALTGVGFAPNFVFSKQTGASSTIFNVSETYGDYSGFFIDAANAADAIQSLDSDGFSLGTSVTANASGVPYHYVAFGGAIAHTASGTFKATSGTYTGNGTGQTIVDLAFEPDLVVIAASGTQYAVFRTRDMGNDSTAFLANAAANFAGGITTLGTNSFTLGNSATVNAAGVEYVWTAYGNAWDPETHTGAADFTVGMYYGNGLDNRDITRLPFAPDFVAVKRSGATQGVWRSSEHSGDLSSFFHGAAEAANNIQALTSDGFEVGTAANVNTAANLYPFFAFATSSSFAVGTYSGTGVAQTVATPLAPAHVWVKQTGAVAGVLKTASTTGSTSLSFANTAPQQDGIEQLTGSGFLVGASTTVNAVGVNNYRYAAWRDTDVRGTSTYRMQTGYFVGNGGSKDITGLGFTPDLVIVKADTNAGTGATWKSSAMPQQVTAHLGSATADNTAGQITLIEGGFRVAGANTSAANTRYTYVAVGGSDCSASGTFCVGRFTGTGAATLSLTTGFSPELVWVKRSTAVLPSWRSSTMAVNVANFFSATAEDATGAYFTTLDGSGFTVGTTNNASGGSYYFVAFSEAAGAVDVGTYTGNLTVDRSIAGVGFSPDWVFTKQTGASAAVYNQRESYGDHSSYFADTANLTDAIQVLEADGFQVGGNSTAHANGVVYHYAALGGALAHAASGTFTTLSGSYVGTGDAGQVTGLGFAPDLVIIKGDVAQSGVFASKLMAGDSTAYLDQATANFAGGITALGTDGFSIGTNASVNSDGVTYYWTAYGNAWNPETHRGAADFALGAHYGNGIDGRDVTRIPFSPDLVALKRNGVTGGTWRTSAHAGDASSFFAATAEGANRVQALNADGFEVGTNAEANLANNIYWSFAFAESATFAVGTYSGTGVSQTITVGFQPYHLWVKHTGATRGVSRPYALAGDGALPFISAGLVSGAISAFAPTGFAVDAAVETNTSGANNYRFAAWKKNELEQTHYHWRYDDGDEDGASSATGGAEDTALSDVREGLPYRLRIGLANIASVAASSTGFRIEFAEKGATCAAATGWARVGDAGGAWDLYDSPNLTQGANTTNIPLSSGGVSDENDDFMSPNGGIADTGDETPAYVLAASEFAELEYALTPTVYATSAVTYCFRVTAQGTPLSMYLQYAEATFRTHVTATTLGTQVSEVIVPSSSAYLGGAFVLTDATTDSTHSITDIEVTESGTVDAAAHLDNIKLFYEYDTSAPYDCASESYGGSEAQYGLTDSDGFSGQNGTSAFAGSVSASSTQAVCLYPVLDVVAGALSGQTVELSLASASAVTVAGGEVPRFAETPLHLSGDTTLVSPLLTATHYHWRSDDGSEATAGSATGGIEDTPLLNLTKGAGRRLRIGVSNEGLATSSATSFRVEYAERSGTCSATTNGWTDVGAVGGAWDMYDSANLTEGADTTNIALASGGVTDENTTFLTANGGVRDTTSQTGALSLGPAEHTELEYSLVALAGASDGTSYCFRVTDAGTPLPAAAAHPEVLVAADVLVSSLGTHVTAVRAGASDTYIAGPWVVTDQGGGRNVTGVLLSETGSVDGANNLANIRLYYDLDTSAPYTCASESYAAGDSQFGATSTAFSAANGTTSFSGSVGISGTATLCLYAVLDVRSTAENGETITLSIANPSTDVAVSSGTVNPNDRVAPSGTTTIERQTVTQEHYHFRRDDGGEAAASSATGGSEDTPRTGMQPGVVERLRIALANQGGTTTLASTYRLEYAEKVATCAAVGAWQTVGSPGAVWSLAVSEELTDGSDTTNIAVATGGVTDEQSTFLSSNNGVHNGRATSGALVLDSDEFVEYEYVLEPNVEAAAGASYCFRVALASGAALDAYDTYPEATLAAERDFFVQRGVVDIANGTSTVSLVAGTHYTAPRASTSAFIRITNAMYTGAGATAGGGNQNANSVTTSILNPSDILTGVTFRRAGAVNSTRIYWELVEYVGPPGGDNEFIVRAQERVAYGAADTSVSRSGVPGVADDGQVAVFITGQENPAGTLTDYHAGISTAAWTGASDTATFTRGAANGYAAALSFAVIEWTGANWRVQRVEHTHGVAGANETEVIVPVNDTSRAFLHTQKRVGVGQVDEFGHQVWLSGVGDVTFSIPATAASPGTHVSVAWVIENTQTNGSPMVVTRSNGTQAAGGAEPSTYPLSIGTTISATNNASIFMNVWGLGDTTNHPRAIMGAGITGTAFYELWISDTGSGRTYRTEVVDWPTAELSFEQYYYRWYEDNDALDPTDAWPSTSGVLGENTAITLMDEPPTAGDVLRLRTTVRVHGASLSRELRRFKLQYAARTTTCGAVASWYDIGDSASTTSLWRGYNASPADGTALSTDPPTVGDLNLSVSISGRAGTYEESNPTAINPYKASIGETIEYDWVLEPNNAPDKTTYCFRMVEEDGTEYLEYTHYPTLTTAGFEVAQHAWRWYDDADVVTPLVPLAATNTAPSNVALDNVFKLRVLLSEVAGKAGTGVKYKLQYSEYPDFSVVADVASADACAPGSRFCYTDGGGADTAQIQAAVLFGADSCSGGEGQGCGTHNELPYTPDIVGETGTTSVTAAGMVVTLAHTYDDPVFIVESVTGDPSGGAANRPAAAFLTATSTSSFTVRVGEPDDEPDTHGAETVAYLVMERGAYQLPAGPRVDANSTTTSAYRGSVVGGSAGTCTFVQAFDSAPVLVAALQSNNNTGSPDFLTASVESVAAASFGCAIDVADGVAVAPSLPETIGWVAFSSGTFKSNGVRVDATSTNASITGWTDTPWYEYVWPYGTWTSAPGLLASRQTRNGSDGGWVRYGALTSQGVRLAVDEADGGNRSHIAESVGMLGFSRSGTLYRATTSASTFEAYANKEFEFTLRHHDARPGRTYYFRLYDVAADSPVTASTTQEGYPSLLTESGTLSFSVFGVASGVSTEGVTTDITTTPLSVPFGSLPLGTPKTAAQRLVVSTNAGQGYQVLAFEVGAFEAGVGASIADVTGTNEVPLAWSTACDVGTSSCYGYHTGDDTLSGGSLRFLPDDTYAALTNSPKEVAWSSIPVTAESTDIIYRVRAGAGQEAGHYESKISYVVVPVF